jgi:hypothetical protein
VRDSLMMEGGSKILNFSSAYHPSNCISAAALA